MLWKRDPVCGKKVSRNSEYFVEYNGKTYYFDSPACKNTFQEEPQKYTQKNSTPGFLKRMAKDKNSVPKCCHQLKN